MRGTGDGEWSLDELRRDGRHDVDIRTGLVELDWEDQDEN